VNLILSKSYKILFITLLIVGGFLFLGKPQPSSAALVGWCCCNDGNSSTYSLPSEGVPCDSNCGSAGVQLVLSIDSGSPPACSAVDGSGTTTGDETTDPCLLDPESEGCAADTTTDSCGGCPDGTVCQLGADGTSGCVDGSGTTTGDETTDPCLLDPESEGCAADATTDSCGGCPDGTVCQLGTNTCVDGNADGTLPGSGPTGNIDDATPRTAGPAVRMLNLSGITSIQDLFAKIIVFITPLVMLFAGVMIIWSGFLFVTAQGDPTAITKAKQNFIWTVTGVAIVLASGAIVDYVSGLLGGTSTGSGTALRNKIETILRDQIIPILFLLVTVYFFWGIITYVRAGGDQKAIDTGKQHMLWGIIGMAVMASAWGIVGVIASMVQ